ncbi:MAG: enoyl-CoA hydratase family protein [Proteobacteria bacterium]|nr:enoyl-CoA hydratase family protein [Pseudomonadota bacterium]
MDVGKLELAGYAAKHFRWEVRERIGWVTLNRPERKNPLTFDSYAELRDLFRRLVYATDVRVVVLNGAGGNFCSGGDVHEIIGPLTRMSMPQILEFTRMTGDLVRAIRNCPQPVIAAVDGVCAGAGAILAMCSDIRLSTPESKTAFLFTRVGLAGCDMGACAILPRIIGQGRAAEWLLSGRNISAEEALASGFYSRLVAGSAIEQESRVLASTLASGPTFAHGITKTMLNQEWNMGLDQALESEAQAQALCMKTDDFRRAFEAFAGKRRPGFQGN